MAVQYHAFFTIPSTFWTGVFVAVGSLFSALANFSLGRNVLLRYPKVFTLGTFSHEGPTEEQLRETSFQMDFFTSGFLNADDAGPQKRPDTKVDGLETLRLTAARFTLALLDLSLDMLLPQFAWFNVH